MTCLCLDFPFLLVTINIVLSGLVTMHRVQGQSISRIHTHQATSLSLVSLLCLCRRCKKELQVSSCLDWHIQPQWSLFTGLYGNVSLCCTEPETWPSPVSQGEGATYKLAQEQVWTAQTKKCWPSGHGFAFCSALKAILWMLLLMKHFDK